jgi:deazaflavin-dependent oxidoreductase (nitroreductase family)
MADVDWDNPEDPEVDWARDHVRRYVETNGEDGHEWRGTNSLLLTTVGQRSGKTRRSGLIYGRDGDRYVIVASKGGAPRHPGWYHNLVAHPEVRVQVKGDVFQANARTAAGEERERLWRQMADQFPPYDEYQEKTDREIPVVVLERV